ncbi:MAG: glucoamylase family protein [Ferruginibacter sp.]
MVRIKLLVACLLFSFLLHAQEYDYNYIFFTNSAMNADHFFSATDNTGSFLFNRNFKMLVSDKIFHSPGNSLQLGYINAKGGSWKATVFHQPRRGMDHFKKAAFLSFWLYNPAAETMLNDLPVVQLMKNDSSLTAKMVIPALPSKVWQQVIIPTAAITAFDPNKPANIIGVVFSQKEDNNSKKQALYIDDIEFLSDKNAGAIAEIPVIIKATGYAMHVDLSWKRSLDKNIKLVKIYRSLNGTDYKPVGVQQPYINRFADFTGEMGRNYFYKICFLNNNYEEAKQSAAIEVSTRAMTDDELLSMVQEASFRYYWEGAESNSGLAKENTSGRQNMIATGAAGFGMMALITGTERKFITRKESVERFVRIVNFLEKAETFHGVYPHFINGPTGKVEPFFGKKDNGADLVETSFLMEGLLAARQYFSGNDPQEKLIRDKITAIWKKADWDWFKQMPNSKFLYWHWSPDQGWIINHPLIGWNETMATYLLAIASPTHPVPASMYYSGWASQGDTAQKYRAAWGGTKDGSMYTNGNTYSGIKLDVGVSSGGPLFFTHYSYMGYDPHFITDNYTNYFRNNQKIAKINHRYCVENPGHYTGYSDSAWGLTASDGPYNYAANEPLMRKDDGKLTPTGAISSFPYTPVESMRALRNYYFNYGKFLWGEYGFKDAFDLSNNWCSEIYMGLNQAPMVVMIENYRSGLLWKLFTTDPDVKAGMEKLQEETTIMINNRR